MVLTTMTKRIIKNFVLAEDDVQPPGNGSERGFEVPVAFGQDPHEEGPAPKEVANPSKCAATPEEFDPSDLLALRLTFETLIQIMDQEMVLADLQIVRENTRKSQGVHPKWPPSRKSLSAYYVPCNPLWRSSVNRSSKWIGHVELLLRKENERL